MALPVIIGCFERNSPKPQNFGESRSAASTARLRVTPLNSVQLNQRLQVLEPIRALFYCFNSCAIQMRRLKIDGVYPSTLDPNDSSADFFAAPASPVAFARAASGRSGIGTCRPTSLVQALMAGGGGSGLPSGVVALGQEKQAIESLLQKVCRMSISKVASPLTPSRATLLER